MPLRGPVYIARPGLPQGGATGAMHVGGSELARQRVAHAGVTARARRGHVGPPCPPRRTGDGTRGRRGPAGAIGADDETRARGWRLSRPSPPRYLAVPCARDGINLALISRPVGGNDAGLN